MEEYLEKVILVRLIEQKIQEIYNTDVIKSPVHLSIGQELLAAVVSKFISKEDKVVATYRGHALSICLTDNLQVIIDELFAKKSGVFGGRGGSMHLGSDNGIMPWTSAIVASGIPVAVGMAEAAKRQNAEDGLSRIVFCQFGDGAMEEGVFIESINFAALKNLPIVFSCEDNDLAIFTRKTARTPSTKYTDRIAQWGIHTEENSYRKPKELISSVDRLINHARNQGPVFMVTECYRWLEHVGVGYDWDLGYRHEKELEQWKKYDVVLNPELLGISKEKRNSIEDKVKQKIIKLFDNAEKAIDADFSDLLTNVY